MRSPKNRHARNRTQSPNGLRRKTLLLLALFLSIWAQLIAAESALRATTQDSWLAHRANWAKLKR